MQKINLDNVKVTVTMTGTQMRALIDHIDLTVTGNNLSDAESATLYLMSALHNAEVTQQAIKTMNTMEELYKGIS